MNRREFSLMSGGALGLLCCARAAPEGRQTETFIPFRFSRSGLLLIDVDLGDAKKSVFLVDTGATMGCIAKPVAQRYGLEPRPARKRDGTPLRFPDGAPISKVTISRLRLGSITLTDEDLVVLKSTELEAAAKEPIDGIIGADNLQSSAVGLDFDRRILTLIHPGPVTRSQLVLNGFLDAVAVPMPDPRQNLRYWVKAKFSQDVEENLLVDTGSITTGISRATALRLKLRQISPGRGVETFQRRYLVDFDRVPRLSLGAASLDDIEVEYPQRDEAGIAATVGLDVLARFRCLLDMKQELLYLRPRDKPGG